MTPEQSAAYIFAQAAYMLAEMESMKAANLMRIDQGHTIAFGEEAFLELPDRYGLGHNAVIALFNQAQR